MLLLAYIVLASSHVLGGGNGEFVALSRAPGIAHPPGYPLYVLYLRLMSWLPGEAAHSAALATAILGGLQLGLLYIGARAWKAPPLASAIAVTCYSASALAVHLNGHAEVFALNGLLASALLVLYLRLDISFVVVPHWPDKWYRRRLGIGDDSDKDSLLLCVAQLSQC